jgi:acetylornithine deacetylase/succinyl-diaminopimelate desuccinylase-like protein
VLDGVQLLGDGSVADMVWARPSATVVGIDAPSVAGAVNAVQAAAGARISLRLPPQQEPKAAQALLIEHLRRRVPWGLQAELVAVETGSGFASSPDGPAFEALSAALAEGAGRPVAMLGEGGSIPLANVLQSTFPQAEVLLFGIEEPGCHIHAPNESVAPGEIERTALAEARFLRAYGAR